MPVYGYPGSFWVFNWIISMLYQGIFSILILCYCLIDHSWGRHLTYIDFSLS